MLPTIAIIIPTRNRPEELRALLACIERQTIRPVGVTVIDSSDEPQKAEVRQLLAESPLAPRLVDHWPPSAAAQRNHGLDLSGDAAEWVLMLDDDISIEPECLENLQAEAARLKTGHAGLGLNPTDKDAYRKYGALRSLGLFEQLGFYSRKIGKVMPSGWHTRTVHVTEDCETDWLTTCAVMWNLRLIDGERFDEFFQQYSYLEDLEFSYRMRGKGRLVLLAGVEYHHAASPKGRNSPQWFGRIEIRNRFYFVRKHGLSMTRCRIAMAIRIAMTACEALVGREGQFGRLKGNLAEVFRPPPRAGAD